MPATDHRVVLKRVGILLIVVGLLDVASMIYCIIHGLSYKSSLNIFAVIAGVFLFRGNLTAVQVVTYFLAFLISGMWLGLIFVFPFMQPLGLWKAQLNLNPVGVLQPLVFGIAALGVLSWVYLQLRSKPVLEARVASGQSRNPPVAAFVAGAALAALIGAIVLFTLRGEGSEKAKQLAKAQVGPGFEFAITAMRWSGSHHSASVTAYSPTEIKHVVVEWEE